MVAEITEKPLAPTTTTQENLTTARQRKVNLIWEYTQAGIALGVTLAAIVADFMVGIGLVVINVNQLTALLQLNGMALLIIGFYFSRTNHTQIGGVGEKQTDTQEYQGR